MASAPEPPKWRDGALTALDVFIQGLSLAKDTCHIPPAQIAFGTAAALLTMIRDTMTNNQDFIDLGRACGDVCQTLYRKLKGKRSEELNQSILDAIGDLTTIVAGIQRKVVKQSKRNPLSRFLLSKADKDKIAGWKQDLFRILQVFNTELVIDIYMVVTDLQRNASTGQEDAAGRTHLNQASVPVGELPPPAPRDCFGRWELIEQVVNLAENLQPIALIGAGGIGKTSIALTVLHHNRMKERFGENRRFIRCDRFPASRANFLTRLSKVIGAGVDNPDGLMPLRPLLSSKEMLIILDNAESILDPQGTGAREIYDVVDELCRFKTISLCITSRATTVPRHCKRLEIPTLSLRSACDIFYSIYGNRGRSAIVDNLLRRLDFHALSIALLATTASHNGWDYDRLAEEWDSQRAQMLQTGYYESLATTIQLSLASPTFRSLGSNARDLLGVIAFFPQGVNEKNLKWLFPDIPNRRNVFDQLCVLSLTYRSNGFITMLAPLRDYLRPQYPPSSPLLCTTRDRYLSRLSIDVNPDKRGFEEARWIVSEDMNVEYLLDVFISIDQSMGDVWDPYYIWEPCYHFMEHLYWHKPRQTTLKSKIEALPDDHRSKPKCLSGLSGLFERVGNYGEQKRLLSHTLELERQRGDNPRVAQTLQDLSNANRSLQLYDEGLRQAKEALEIFKWIGDTEGQTQCLSQLAWLLFDGEQLDAAENTASHAINLASEKNQGYVVCKLHQVLGNVYRSKREKKKAIYHFETALKIASLSNWRDVLFWNNYDLATLFRNEGEFDRAIVHIKQAKSHAVDDAYKLGRAMKMQARVWYRQGRLEEAKSEALSALEIYERSGAADDAEVCRTLLQKIDQAVRNRPSRFYA